MAQPVIQVEGLGKQYVIGGREAGRESFREMLTASLAAPLRRFRRLSGDVAPEERIWALKDVSFHVGQGEVVGVIGRNGAGKSTLLKILSRITEPTEGRVKIRGRVASLLEVGTGFHPELTGRENIYLNGAILGMARSEIDRKFDEIVAFAGIERFLYTPVKRYSSGMYVRLAFAVAANLDPDVLLVDEVLAVGDVEFQRKCLGKMQDVVTTGRTVVFVSHNMAAVSALCARVVLLMEGRVNFTGGADETIQRYMSDVLHLEVEDLDALAHFGSGEVRIESVTLRNGPSESSALPLSGNCCRIEVAVESNQEVEGAEVHLGIYDNLERPLAILASHLKRQYFDFAKGRHKLVCEIPKLPLAPGTYALNASVLKGGRVLDGVANCASIRIEHGDYYGSGFLPPRGPFLIDFHWRTESQLTSGRERRQT